MLSRSAEPLRDWTTLRLGGPAREFVDVSSRSDLYASVEKRDSGQEPVLVLGGGSNLVIADDGFDGTVVRVARRGVRVGGDACGGVEVTVEAGENRDEFVARAVAEEWIGVEALAGIPGTVGAVPIQNVGEVPKYLASRRAVSAVTAVCSLANRSIRVRGTPTARATV